MADITIRGVDHYYEWVKAEDESSSKPVMVFMHGWGGSARYWRSTAEKLSDAFDCLLYDMRGFGRSRLPGTPIELGYELEDYADDLAHLLDALHLDQVYLNAHSMGASIAVLFLNRYPQRVKKAILTCSGVFEYEEKSFKAFHKFGGYVVKFRPNWLQHIPYANRMFMARFLHRPLPDLVSREFLQDFLMADYGAALQTIFTAVSERASTVMPQEFAQIQVPTLLVAGEHDIIIPASMGQKAAEFSQNVQYVKIPDTAHFPMLEAPEEYLQVVREFLDVKTVAQVN